MAVVAVLLNNKLYVANVGEPPTCPRAGSAGREISLKACVFFGQSASQTCKPSSPCLLRPWGPFPYFCTGMPQSQCGELAVLARRQASRLSSPLCPNWLWASCVPSLGHLSGFLSWKRLPGCGRPTRHPRRGGEMGWVRGHKDIWICGQRRGHLGTQGLTHRVQITVGVV